MDRQILHYLQYVGNRFRIVRFGWLLAGLWLVLAGLFFLRGTIQIRELSWISYAWFAVPPVGLGLWFINRFAFRDVKWLAFQVESKFPELNQKLITSAEPPSQNVSPFLRRSLLLETIQHARSHDWMSTVPTGRLLLVWSTQLLCFLLACSASVYSASQCALDKKSDLLSLPTTPLDAMFVEPGDAEVERGTDLVVTVRFSGKVPQDAWLVVESSQKQEDSAFKSAMQNSLRDPLFGGYLRRIATDLKYHIESEQGKSPTYSVKVFDYPNLLQSDAMLEPPRYAERETKVIRDTRRVTVAEGTRLTWTCTVNKPLATAELVDEAGNKVSLQPSTDNPLQLSASFDMEISKKWRVRLVDSSQRESKFEETLSAKVIPNNEPEIKLARAGDVQASPLQELNLQAIVRDDFHVTRTGITVSLAGSEPIDVPLQAVTHKGGKSEVTHLVDLESMGAKPDQLLSYYFWAEDLDRHGQPRRVDGEMFFAEIRPFEEIFREGDAPPPSQQREQQEQQQSQSAQQAEQLAELQKQVISGTWNVLRRETRPVLSATFAADVSVLSESQRDALEQTSQLEGRLQDENSKQSLGELQEQMRIAQKKLDEASSGLDLDDLRQALSAERKAYEGLLKIRAREHSIVKSEQQQSRGSRSSAQQSRQNQIDQLKLSDEENKYESEKQAADERTDPQRETRQVMNRLEELARRQKDLNEQLKELESSLREAKTEEKKQEIEERLARLRESQEELIRDSDELLERMNEPENRQQMQEAREKVEQARQQLQQASQALKNNQTSQAFNSGTRAERQMEEIREQLRKESSTQMQESMKDLVRQARELEKTQTELRQKLIDNNQSMPNQESQPDRNENPESDRDNSPLRPRGTQESTSKTHEEWLEQKKRVNELLDEIKETVSEAESSEPLMAEELYEGFREAKQIGIEKQVEQIPMLLNRGFDSRAEQLASESAKGISQLRERIEKASENVLGSEQESLRRALREIDTARQQLVAELNRKSPESGRDSRTSERDSQKPPKGTSQESNNSENESESDRQNPIQQAQRRQQLGNSSPPVPSAEQTSDQTYESAQLDQTVNSPLNNQSPNRQADSSATRLPQTSDAQPNDDRSERSRGSLELQQDPNARDTFDFNSGIPRLNRGMERLNDSLRNVAPLTGEEYSRWMDALRDIEELMTDNDRKADVARIREAAREMRINYKRHSKEPQWDLVRKLIANPLERLREQVNEDLLRLAAEKSALVPIDRDPVPSQYQRRLDQYYENLGRGNAK